MIYKIAEKLNDKLISIRREFHKIPELEFEEFKTSILICKYLDELGLKYEKLLNTGIVCNIKGKKGDGKTILLRADIDALPILEKNDLPYKSEHENLMHACGHDVHITALLGVCMILKELDFDFCGNIKAVFQPAEEGRGGALPMIEAGVMSSPKVDAALALHVEPQSECGTLQYKNNSIMASPDDFKIIIKGKGGHGACPEDCINPIYVAAKLIEKISKIVPDNFKNKSDCVVSVCTINSGTQNNIIPDSLEITGTARSLDNETRKKIEKLLEQYTIDVCKTFSCSYDYIFNKMYPPVINDNKINEILIKSANQLGCFKEIKEQEKPSMTGDDFSYFSNLVPSAYFKLGAGNKVINEPLHSPFFNVDEKCIKLGAAILTKTALNYLENNENE